jgi:hypothetical protein
VTVDRANRYEAAFEEYLRDRALPYIGVDEQRRATLGDGPVKSLDFIVYGLKGARFLIDVKGRKFPGKSGNKPRTNWECWSTRGDVDGLRRWQEIFGPGYEGAFVFMYELGDGVVVAKETPDQWVWRDQPYLLRAVLVDDFARNMRVRSPKWDTVHLPVAAYRQVVKPLWEYTHLRTFMAHRQPAGSSA